MRVAFVSQFLDRILPPYQNSVGACTYGAARALARHCEVVVYGSADMHSGMGSELVDQGVRYRFFPASRVDGWLYGARRRYSRLAPNAGPISSSSLMYPSFARRVAEDLRRRPCDAIHIQHGSQYAAALRALNPQTKIVLHMHAEWFSQGNPRVFERRLRNVDLVTAVSAYVTNKTRQDFPGIAERCEVMYNGIEAEEFRRQPNRGASGPRRILYAGAIAPHRGLHVLLAAFNRVVSEYPDVRLELVGPPGNYPLQEVLDVRDRAMRQSVAAYYSLGPVRLIKDRLSPAAGRRTSYMDALKASLSSEAAGKVCFHGWVGQRQELVAHYYRGDIFAMPSICNDSFCLPAVEAMAAGLPVVASRSGGLVETVTDGETGYIVEKNDPQGLAQALLALLRDETLMETMGKAARKRALSCFTWDQVGETMHRRYQELCFGKNKE